jgi:histidyl-tRNA synthetase
MDRLPGFRDFYPEPLPASEQWSADVRQYIFDSWRRTARRYAFREYDGPPLEELELFTTKSGDEIIGQLYNFCDKGGREVSLRPEMTPTLARMFASRERSFKKPAKWFAIPQLFRYERQQKGRLREHFQFNADILGEVDTAADSELVALLIDSLKAFGLTQGDFVIRLSSRNAWSEFYRAQNGIIDNEYAFYQAVDKLERSTKEETSERLARTGVSYEAVMGFIERGEPSRELDSILENLRARGLGTYVSVDYRVIRGLAYYTGPVFEAFDCKGEFRAIAGGGRYDNLLKLISAGKVNLPALGFGMGDVVLTELLKARGLLPAFEGKVDAFCLIEDESRRLRTLGLVQLLRTEGLITDFPLTPMKADKQFNRARELKTRFLLQIEGENAGDAVVKIRRMTDRVEAVVTSSQVIEQLRSLS